MVLGLDVMLSYTNESTLDLHASVGKLRLFAVKVSIPSKFQFFWDINTFLVTSEDQLHDVLLCC